VLTQVGVGLCLGLQACRGSLSGHCGWVSISTIFTYELHKNPACVFLCAGELEDLLSRLQQLAATAGGAPLMTVQQPGRVSSASDAAAAAAAAGGGVGASGSDAAAGGGGRADDWELV
jgi:hypothetical protein